MYPVKCKYCGKSVPREEAYVVAPSPGQKRNKYYCCEEHSLIKSYDEQLFDLCISILGERDIPLLLKALKELKQNWDAEQLYTYILNDVQRIDSSMTKDFSTPYGRMRYFIAIVKNNIVNFRPPEEEVKIEVVEQEYESKKRRESKPRVGLDDLLDSLYSK